MTTTTLHHHTNIKQMPQKAQTTAKINIIKDVHGNAVSAEAINADGEAIKSLAIKRDKSGEIIGGDVTNAEDEQP